MPPLNRQFHHVSNALLFDKVEILRDVEDIARDLHNELKNELDANAIFINQEVYERIDYYAKKYKDSLNFVVPYLYVEKNFDGGDAWAFFTEKEKEIDQEYKNLLAFLRDEALKKKEQVYG